MAGIGHDYNDGSHYRSYPGTLIGRAAEFYHVRFADLKDGTIVHWENFRIALSVIQTGMEVMWVSAPYVSNSYGAFQVMVAADTANISPQNGDTIQAQLRTALEDGDIIFRREHMAGSNWYTDSDFVDYVVNSNYFPDNVVYAGVEQDALVALINA